VDFELEDCPLPPFAPEKKPSAPSRSPAARSRSENSGRSRSDGVEVEPAWYPPPTAMAHDASPDPESETPTPEVLRAWESEFAAAAQRSLRTRFRYAFIRTYKPVMDDASYRSFATTAEYRDWCEANLPSWLGYGRAI
jgi:hypothetical protein